MESMLYTYLQRTQYSGFSGALSTGCTGSSALSVALARAAASAFRASVLCGSSTHLCVRAVRVPRT